LLSEELSQPHHSSYFVPLLLSLVHCPANKAHYCILFSIYH
jgi:hypothetical protein